MRRGDTLPDPSTFVDVLRRRAEHQPERRIHTFLVDGEAEEVGFSCAALDRRARAIAASLQSELAAGERVLLLSPPGPDYVATLFGCLYAGVVAIPAYPPRLNRHLARLESIVADSGATLALATAPVLSLVGASIAQVPALGALRWRAAEEISDDRADDWREPMLSPDDIAYLQYTSGSTGSPKGVMVTHRNLLHNCALIERGFELSADDTVVLWLPPYHDMGLVGGVFQPAYGGFQCVLMSPVAFLQRPFRWLQAISRHRGTVAGAPNFAYELCARKISAAQRASLDLSSWALAFNGAEPVHDETLERFVSAFGPCGFRREAFYPCYGLAEATLIVSGGQRAAQPVLKTVNRAALSRDRVADAAGAPGGQTLVGCGQGLGEQSVVVVNPESFTRCAADQIGEIWVSGASVTAGYWNRPEETEQTFRARLAESGEGPFLRTGDLGFVDNGQVYVTGRLKDLVIIRGRNHYPQDIEFTVERSHPVLRPASGAAFSIDAGEEEQLVVVHEVERRRDRDLDLDEVINAIRQAISEEHELQLGAVTLIERGSLAKTTSGKIQRRACRDAFLAGTLEVVKEWRSAAAERAEDPEQSGENRLLPPPLESATAEAIETWLVAKLSRRLGLAPGDLDPGQPLARYGVDSLLAVQFVSDVEEWLGQPLPPTIAWDYPTVAQIARHLAGLVGAPAAAPPGVEVRPESPPQKRDEVGAEPIAVIGLACRFPGAPNAEAYWELLRNGVDAISEVPPERWNVDALYDPNPAAPGKTSTRWGGFLKQIDQFDAHFFGIAPREAVHMDPQQRLVLEVAWEALESAALPADRLAGSQTGVFIGIESADYSLMLCTDRTRIDAYVGTGNAPCVASNRVSYLLDLRGPSMAIDTACSASLVAIHLACQSLRAAESDLALAGGVNLMLSPETTINLSKARMLAADGRCKTFDTRADGYVRGDGCGVVVLKRLSDALKDGDPVLALIRGSAVNQDGRSNGLTAPNGLAQQAVIRRALEVARLAPEDISYVEAHGTGTPLGDPIEIQALAAVLSSSRAETKPCAVGSVKTNIGHLETAAGVAGLIKVILALQHEQIPPHLHLRQLNPRISFDGTRLFVPTEPLPWPRGEALRSAGVSAFSFGGTNAHVIVQEAPVRAAARDAGLGPLPFCLSAKSQSALRDFARRYEEHLGRHPDAPLADVCYTAARGRSHFSHRLAIIADSTSQLREQLRAFVEGRKLDAAASGQLGTAARPKVAFLFTGQGSQYSGMGRRLYETRPVFREAVDRCADILRPHLDRPLASLLFASADSALDETAYTQPALFALEYALAQLWRSCGIEPDAVIGHSVGEYVAATIAGVFSLEDGLRLIAERARLMQSLPREGAMVAVFAGEAEVARALGADRDRASIAAVNAPQSTVISGEREAVAAVLGRLAPGVETRALNVSHAFHSPLMDPVVDAFESAARRVSFKPPSLTLVSNVSGRTVDPREAPDAAYWSRHLRQPVRFAAGVNTLWEHGCRIFVEIGPSPTLVHLGKRCVPDGMGAWLASLEPGQEDDRRIMMSAAQLYALGQEVNWSGAVPAFKDARRIALPTYPFQRSRYWFATAAAAQLPSPRPPTSRPASSHPLLGRKLDTAGTLSMMERAA